MKILVTGSNGYIGKSIALGLCNEYNITTINRKTLDLLDSKSVNQFFYDKYFDIVIHCASVGGNRLVNDDDLIYKNNMKMFNNIYENKNNFGRLITFGSGVELTNCTKPYCCSKKDIRKIILKTKEFYNIRIFAVFDENELNRRFIKSSLLSIIEDKPIKINQNKLMDFFYMEDLITLVKFYLTSKSPPKELDCSYKHKYTLVDIADMINEITNKSNIQVINSEIGESYVGNYLFLNKLQLNLVGLRRGIIKTYKKLL